VINDPAARASAAPAQSSDGAGEDPFRTQLRDAFADRYHVNELLGRGQCSTTFAAVQADLGRHVALKVLHFDRGTRQELARRVADEVRISQGLADECLLVYSRFERRESVAVIVMPFMPGGSVEALLRGSASTPLARIQEIVRGIATSLDCLHRHGAVHLGLTPTNILFDSRGGPLIADRGVTNMMLEAEGAHGTRSSRARAYAAPEQRRKQKVDGRADQYALAVIAYELLTGHRRLEEDGVQTIQTLAPIEVLPDVPLRAGVPLYVNAALRRALSAGPANRFETTTQFADAFAGRAPDAVPGLPTSRADLRLLRRHRFAGISGALLAIFVIAIIVDPTLKANARAAWSAVSEHVPGSGKRVELSFDPGPAPAPAPNLPRAASAAGAAGASHAASAPQSRAGTRAASSPNPGHTVAEKPSEPTGSDPITIRLGSSSPSGGPTPSLPGGATTVAGGQAALRGTRLWFERVLNGTWFRGLSSSERAYVHVSVDRGATLVTVDGVPRGSTPATISVDPGHHTVAVHGALDYGAATTGVNASAGDTVSVSFHSVGRP
jgi:serine/threonine protein kinase